MLRCSRPVCCGGHLQKLITFATTASSRCTSFPQIDPRLQQNQQVFLTWKSVGWAVIAYLWQREYPSGGFITKRGRIRWSAVRETDARSHLLASVFVLISQTWPDLFPRQTNSKEKKKEKKVCLFCYRTRRWDNFLLFFIFMASSVRFLNTYKSLQTNWGAKHRTVSRQQEDAILRLHRPSSQHIHIQTHLIYQDTSEEI